MEAKLAETTPKRPLAVTIGAAVVTLVIVAGVLTGPTILSCSGSAEGLGACLSGKLSDVGILPKPAPVAVAETSEPAAAGPEAETAAPPSAPAADVPDIVTPTFGLLRAQPDGSVVIAGSGKPGSEVEVFSNDASVGKTKVEASGDWVLVPEKPLPEGGVELTVGEAGAKDRSNQSFVVVIDPDHKNEPLVVASVPGKASEVLQGLARPPVEQSTQVAAAAPVEQTTAPASASATTAPAEPPAAEAQSVTPQVVAEAAPPATATASPSVSQPAAAPASSDAPAVAPAAKEPATAEASPEAAAPAVAAVEPPAAAPAAPAAPPAEEPQQAAITQPPAAPSAPAEVALAPGSIDAIEIDGSRNFFAGAGPDGATIRLYVDDRFIADSLVRGGRWLVETTENVLSKPMQVVRIDVLRPGTSEVASRAEVNFEVQLPKDTQAPVAVAEAQPPAAAPAAAEAPAAPAEQSAPPAETPTAPAAPPADAASEAPAAPASQAAAETPVQSDVPTMVAVAVGDDPESQRFASGKAIIRSGDNLWTIARRVYGKGIKYTAIYEANTSQIRDPHWIYPGQVFDLPEDKQP